MIEFLIKCNVKGNEDLAELGIDVKQYEFRPVLLDPDQVAYCYPNPEGGCFINIAGDDITVSEEYKEVKARLRKWKA